MERLVLRPKLTIDPTPLPTADDDYADVPDDPLGDHLRNVAVLLRNLHKNTQASTLGRSLLDTLLRLCRPRRPIRQVPTAASSISGPTLAKLQLLAGTGTALQSAATWT